MYDRQTQINQLFFPVTSKPKKQWARPDRPGPWGQRRDGLLEEELSTKKSLRKMKSEFRLNTVSQF
jgi:hypothetical protein